MARRRSPLDHALGTAGRSGGRRIARAAAALLAGTLLAGCADPTGDIDDQGHNGYDQMTCEQAKALALDIQYDAVFAGSAQDRISDLTHDAAKASHPEVRQAATALISGYQARNRKAVTIATTALVKACTM